MPVVYSIVIPLYTSNLFVIYFHSCLYSCSLQGNYRALCCLKCSVNTSNALKVANAKNTARRMLNVATKPSFHFITKDQLIL